MITRIIISICLVISGVIILAWSLWPSSGILANNIQREHECVYNSTCDLAKNKYLDDQAYYDTNAKYFWLSVIGLSMFLAGFIGFSN